MLNGTTGSYWFVVSNTGETELDPVTLTDPLLGVSSNIGPLVSGSSKTVDVTAVHSVDLINTASVSAIDATLGLTNDVSDTASVDVIDPGLDVVKTVSTNNLYSTSDFEQVEFCPVCGGGLVEVAGVAI